MSKIYFLKVTLAIALSIRCNPVKHKKPRKKLLKFINLKENNMQTQTYKVKGMHCASCSSVIEKTLKKIAGVQAVDVNYGTEKAKISFDSSKINPPALSGHIEPLGYSLIMPTTDASTAPSASDMGMSAEDHAADLGTRATDKKKQ